MPLRVSRMRAGVMAWYVAAELTPITPAIVSVAVPVAAPSCACHGVTSGNGGGAGRACARARGDGEGGSGRHVADDVARRVIAGRGVGLRHSRVDGRVCRTQDQMVEWTDRNGIGVGRGQGRAGLAIARRKRVRSDVGRPTRCRVRDRNLARGVRLEPESAWPREPWSRTSPSRRWSPARRSERETGRRRGDPLRRGPSA